MQLHVVLPVCPYYKWRVGRTLPSLSTLFVLEQLDAGLQRPGQSVSAANRSTLQLGTSYRVTII